MKKHLQSLALMSAVLVMGGCAANGPQFTKFETPKEDKSLVYIYRKAIFVGDGLTPNVHQTNLATNEDKIIGYVRPDGYIKTELKEGDYQFWAKTEAKNEVDLKIEKNKIYCIEHYISMGFLIGRPQFKSIPLDKCIDEITKTKLTIQE